jgi:5-methyltetrahydropteroyltriglutamate--homocysteine methyltransferase
MSDFNDSVDGLDDAASIARDWKIETEGSSTVTRLGNRLPGVVIRKIRQKRRLAAHEVAFLQLHSPGDIKMTLPTPNQFPAIAYKPGLSDRAYASYSEFLWDIVPIFKAEIRALANEGVQYIQIDAPRYSYFMDPKWRDWIRAEMKTEPDALLEESIRADNACFQAARRPGVTLAIHLCRGNNRSHWYAEGGYDAVADKLFGTMDVDRFLLEYDDERSGTFSPLRFVPRGKTVVLGLVSSKLRQLENGDELVQRIQEASRFVPLENLALSPQCGFASTMEGNLLTEEEQWAKLRLVAETARRVWG